MNEPVADEVRSILDGHIVMSRDLAGAGHFPAIDVLSSVSRVMSAVSTKQHRAAASAMRSVLATYNKNKDIIALGAYQSGSDPRIDDAVRRIDNINDYLKQATDESMPQSESVEKLCDMFAN
jgi:flagellar biosynthesis/type III secretory pathway ATPase